VGWVWFIAAFVCLVAMNFAARKSNSLTVRAAARIRTAARSRHRPHARVLRERGPQALWQAGGASALFVAGFGAIGLRHPTDLSWLGRASFFALFGLIIFGSCSSSCTYRTAT